MATRIDRDFTFQAAVHFEDRFLLNYYDITLSMDVETESIKEQNIAMDRILYFLSEVEGVPSARFTCAERKLLCRSMYDHVLSCV